MLFFAGFAAIWIYSSTLTYIVDANKGRSSTAIATNSSFRGITGLIVAQVSAPLQDSIGDGGLYTIWTALLVLLELLIVVVMIKGAKWRAAEEEKEAEKATVKAQRERAPVV